LVFGDISRHFHTVHQCVGGHTVIGWLLHTPRLHAPRREVNINSIRAASFSAARSSWRWPKSDATCPSTSVRVDNKRVVPAQIVSSGFLHLTVCGTTYVTPRHVTCNLFASRQHRRRATVAMFNNKV